MTAKIKNSENIPFYLMKPGQIGIVREWPTNKETGKIVQRTGTALFIIGEDNYYPTFFNTHDNILEKYRVSILPHGTEIIL